MALTPEEITKIKTQLASKYPLAGFTSLIPAYSVEPECFHRHGVSLEKEYWEWNFTYLLLILESEGVI